jgi:hypothetical protein
MAHRSRGHPRARPAISPSLANVAPRFLVPGTACSRHEIRITSERPAKMGCAALGLSLHGTLDVAPGSADVKKSSFAVNIQAGSLEYDRDDGELENGKRVINSRQHFLFSKNFQQMIQTRSHVAAGHSETSGMHDRSDFDAEL